MHHFVKKDFRISVCIFHQLLNKKLIALEFSSVKQKLLGHLRIFKGVEHRAHHSASVILNCALQEWLITLHVLVGANFLWVNDVSNLFKLIDQPCDYFRLEHVQILVPLFRFS